MSGNHENPAPTAALPLSVLPRGRRARVREVQGSELGLARRLLEVGFIPGAEVEVVATMWPGADPLAIRVAGSMFALRRHEADCVLIEALVAAERV